MQKPTDEIIYKIVTATQWAQAEADGRFIGAPIDLEDGYIHFSTAAQVAETVEKHFQGQLDLLIATVDAQRFGEALKWEPSRGGDLFPHLYSDLPLDAVLSIDDLPLGKNGRHIFPDEFPV